MMFEVGQKVEYVASSISWQKDGSYVQSEPESWLPATILAVKETSPLAGKVQAHEAMDDTHRPDTVLAIAPDDGQPPFDLNAKLVRVKE